MTWISNLQLNSRKHQPVKRHNQLTPEAPEASTSHVSRWAMVCHPSVPSKSVGNLRAMCWLKWKFATPVRWMSCWRCPFCVFFFCGGEVSCRRLTIWCKMLFDKGGSWINSCVDLYPIYYILYIYYSCVRTSLRCFNLPSHASWLKFTISHLATRIHLRVNKIWNTFMMRFPHDLCELLQKLMALRPT